MSIKSKLKNTKKGFLNPIIIFGILAVVGLAIFAPKIADKLSVVGIADDYLIYDDFEKSYLDDNLWSIGEIETWRTNEGIGDRLSVSDGKLNYYARYSAPTLSLKPTDVKQGMYFKTKAISRRVSEQIGGSYVYYSFISVYMNNVLIYTCQASNTQSSKECIIEGIPSFEDPEIYTLRLNGDDYKTINTSNNEGDNKLEIRIGATGYNSIDYRLGSVYGSVEYLKYKIPYNCKIEDDEVLVFDSFSEGSTVNISNLAYEPVKFCLDYPIKARSFSEEGIKTDIRGEILQKIVRGQSSTVPPAEEWKVYYITKNVPNIELRCGVDEAYNTNTGLCESPNEKAIVGCNAQSDCYIPPGCTGVSCSCVDNKCEYVGSCIYQPQTKSTSLWDKIMTLGFMQWIAGLFN